MENLLYKAQCLDLSVILLVGFQIDAMMMALINEFSSTTAISRDFHGRTQRNNQD